LYGALPAGHERCDEDVDASRRDALSQQLRRIIACEDAGEVPAILTAYRYRHRLLGRIIGRD
jgi:hypothetical protein